MTIERITLDHAGFRELLRSAEVRDLVQEEADAIAEHAGPGMEADANIGRHRVYGGVITATEEARLAEARDRALTKATQARSGR